MKRWALWCSAPILCVVLGLSGCGNSQSPAPEPSQHESRSEPGTVAVVDVPAVPIEASQYAGSAPTARSCYLDMVNEVRSKGSFEVTVGQPNKIVGWAVDQNKAAAANFTLVLKSDRSYALPGHTGGIRPDVAKAVGNQAATTSGFAILTTFADVTPGTYEALIWVKSPNGNVLCDLQRSLRVGNPQGPH